MVLTSVRPYSWVLFYTPKAYAFVDNNLELFCNVLAQARLSFVLHYTVLFVFEVGYRFADGVFKGLDVVVPSYIKYKLALNSKFILYYSPNLFRVY